MTGLLVVLFLSAALYNARAQLSMMGDYYVKNRGFSPFNYVGIDPDPVIEYRTIVTPAPDYLISGDYWIYRKVGPLGLVITADRKDNTGGGGLVNSGQKFVLKNLCNMDDFSFQPFKDRFSGPIDDNCCIEPGNYTLTDWSIEYHMRPKITKMLYGDYTFHICWIEGGNTDKCIVKNVIGIIFDDAKKKEAADKSEMIKNQKIKKAKSKRKQNHHD